MSLYHNYKIADSAAPLDFFRKDGFYVVGNEIYNHKVNALEAATKNKTSVSWNFNNELFESIDWKTPVLTDINELYRMRAQQLREQYDYLVLLYSGGADSTTILKAFLDNGIHLDEIFYDAPFTHVIGTYTPSYNLDPANLLSEYELSAKPMLDQIAKDFPKTKITLFDSTETLSVEDNEDTCTLVSAHNYVIVKRHRLFEDRLRKISETHPNLAVMPGVDKPYVMIQQDVLCAYFDDNRCFIKSEHMPDYRRVIEYFYWTPSMPEIAVKQAQLLLQAIQINPQLRQFFDPQLQDPKTATKDFRRLKRNLMSEIIYPTWNLKTFQADKSESVINSDHYKWATNVDDEAIHSWRSSVQSTLAMIDPKYKILAPDGTLTAYVAFYPRRFYPVGKLKKVTEL